MKNMRHVVNVMRPTESLEGHGAIEGKPTIYIPKVPCSIETLSGQELERARQLVSTATHKVEMYGDPKKPLKRTDFLDFEGRTLEIGQILDKNQNGVELELICGEEVHGG